jgi:hypothetical protein
VITRPTVLILGAGASVDYGFPTGKQLLLEISREVRESGKVSRFLHKSLDIPPSDLDRFRSVSLNLWETNGHARRSLTDQKIPFVLPSKVLYWKRFS